MGLLFWSALVGCAEPGGKQDEVLAMADILGYWTGDWGDMVLREADDGGVVGAYSHDEGTVTGTFDGEVFVGWWCEAPSREPDDDAGDVEFTFLDGGATLDGRWTYGAYVDEWSEDWDLEHVDGDGPEDLLTRFEDPTAFCEG